VRKGLSEQQLGICHSGLIPTRDLCGTSYQEHSRYGEIPRSEYRAYLGSLMHAISAASWVPFPLPKIMPRALSKEISGMADYTIEL
jgi:hypothetical protein